MKKSLILKNGVDDMLPKQEILDELSENLKTWKENYGVKRIGLFGSYSRDKQNESSDIDVVVEFNDSDLSFDNYMDLKMNLEDHFQKTVDLVIINDIKPALKSNILSTITYVEEDK